MTDEALNCVLVVVPAHDEERVLGACLDSIAAAAVLSEVPVHTVVVLDDCTDHSDRIVAGRPDLSVVVVRARRVGVARAVGVAHGLARLTGDPDRAWIASTDADSVVPQGWISHHVDLADAGADLVLGTVDLPPSDHQRPRHAKWRDTYRSWAGDGQAHPHVHAANLGIRASTYLSSGGWPAVAAHEDALLTARVRALPGVSIVSTLAGIVTTSGRLSGRAPAGVAADLRRIGTTGRGTTVPPHRAATTGGR